MSNYERDKERRELLKASGLCPRCGRKIYDKNYITCEICRAKASRRDWADVSEDKKAKYSETRKAKYNALIDSGTCVDCKKKPAAGGLVRCNICNSKAKRVSNKYFSRTAKKGFRELGLCIICGEPTVEGKSYCSKHLKEKRDSAAEARKNINRKNHIWRQLNNETFKNGGVNNDL